MKCDMNMKGKEILVICKQVCEQACGKLWYLTLVSGDKQRNCAGTSERKSLWYVNIYSNSDNSLILLTYLSALHYSYITFYSCLDYVNKNSWKIYILQCCLS